LFVVLVAGALAIFFVIRASLWQPDQSFPHDQEIVATAGTAVQYVVRATDGSITEKQYFLTGGITESLEEVGKQAGPARFNQSSDICDTADGFTALTVRCERFEDFLQVHVIDGTNESARTVLETTIDFSSLGMKTPAADGYLVPVAVADDKSAIFLARRVETESWVAGLWKLDVATGIVSEITYVRENNIYQYDINPQAKKLFGISFVPPESLGEPPTRSEQYWVDLSTGEGYGGELFVGTWENPMLGDDGVAYAFYSTGEHAQEGTTIFQAGEGTYSGGTFIDGVMKDWFGDTVVFDRDGNLFLYDLKTKKETQLTNETDATIEYVGHVE